MWSNACNAVAFANITSFSQYWVVKTPPTYAISSTSAIASATVFPDELVPAVIVADAVFKYELPPISVPAAAALNAIVLSVAPYFLEVNWILFVLTTSMSQSKPCAFNILTTSFTVLTAVKFMLVIS